MKVTIEQEGKVAKTAIQDSAHLQVSVTVCQPLQATIDQNNSFTKAPPKARAKKTGARERAQGNRSKKVAAFDTLQSKRSIAASTR